MKKVWIAVILIVVLPGFLAFWYFGQSKSQRGRSMIARSKSALESGPAIETKSAPEVKLTSEAKPATEASRTPQTSPTLQESRREQPKIPSAPLRVVFEASTPPVLGKPVPVSLVVESNPEVWPKEIGEDCRMEFLLRLPPGIKLESKGWNPVKLPPEEKNDPSGPWSLFGRKQPIKVPAGIPPTILAKEEMMLSVVEPGTNWIITTQARLVSGGQAWQTFGLLLATLDGETAKFHTQPIMPTQVQKSPVFKENSAQAK